MFANRHRRNKIKFHQSARFWGCIWTALRNMRSQTLGHLAPPTSKDFPRPWVTSYSVTSSETVYNIIQDPLHRDIIKCSLQQ